MMRKMYLSVIETADLLEVNRAVIYNKIYQGKLPYTVIEGFYKIRLLDAIIHKQEQRLRREHGPDIPAHLIARSAV